MLTRRTIATALAAAGLAMGMAACGGSFAPPRHVKAELGGQRPAAQAESAGPRSPAPIALVTAQAENRVVLLSLPSGRIIARISVPGEPGYVASLGVGGPAVVVSSRSGTVTRLGGTHLTDRLVLGGFSSPHIPALVPGGGYAYVTDDATGRVAAIGLSDQRVDSRTFVGAGAHHLAFSLNARQAWVALGQAARTIVILSTAVSAPSPGFSMMIDPRHPHIVGHLLPGYLAHDLLFSPDGRRVWITAAYRPYIGVFSAGTHRLLFRVPAGAPPQHVVFAGRDAY